MISKIFCVGVYLLLGVLTYWAIGDGEVVFSNPWFIVVTMAWPFVLMYKFFAFFLKIMFVLIVGVMVCFGGYQLYHKTRYGDFRKYD